MPIQPTSSDPKDLIKSIKSGVPCPNLVYIFGTDRVRKQRALDALFGLVFGAESSSAITKINASELDQQKLQIFEDARNWLSLFSSKRMFVVDGAEEFPDKAADSLSKSLFAISSNDRAAFEVGS